MVRGDIVLTPDAKQPFEVHAFSVELREFSPRYPLKKKRLPWSFCAPSPICAPHQSLCGVFRVRAVAAFAIHRFFTNGVCIRSYPADYRKRLEGAGEMFRVTRWIPRRRRCLRSVPWTKHRTVFGKATSLTYPDSWKPSAWHCVRRVYTFGPTFRAENSTRPVRGQFWMIEPEIAFADLEDVCSSRRHGKYVRLCAGAMPAGDGIFQ